MGRPEAQIVSDPLLASGGPKVVRLTFADLGITRRDVHVLIFFDTSLNVHLHDLPAPQPPTHLTS